MKSVQNDLFAMAEEEYRTFQGSLVPAVPIDSVIGVRVPLLRRYAKTFTGEERDSFLSALPHRYYDENLLHAIFLQNCNEFCKAINLVEDFLPYIDNWAVCDCPPPKAFAAHKELLYPFICRWLNSDQPYTVRYALGLLLRYYLDDDFSEEHLCKAAGIDSKEYYVQMMVAWYFATALAKQYDAAVIYLTKRRLPQWIHNKTISKAIESRRISAERKQFLRSLKY